MHFTPQPATREGPRLRGLHALALLVALAPLLVACAGTPANGNGVATLDDPAADASATPATSLDPEEAMLAFAECMRDHGIDMPDPVVNGEGGMAFEFEARPGGGTKGMDDVQAAHEACQQYLPQGGPNGRPNEIDPEMEQQLLDFAACMRDHGIDFPDPQFGNGFVQIGGSETGPDFDPESEAFQAAAEACGENLPGGGPGFSVGRSTGDDGGPSTSGETDAP